jgi:benzil reductase ((S)-benzoin forming)
MRLALLTGGSKGLGLALSEGFAEQGFRVLEFSRSAPHSYSVPIDLASPENSLAVVADALASLGTEPVDEILVVNNAGTLDPIGPASKKPSDLVLANLNTNFTTAILVLAEVVRHFQTTPCRKVLANISSGAAKQSFSGWSLYCAAKAGLEHFVHSLAIEQQAELYPFIPININPGVIDTEMQALIRGASLSDFPDRERFIQRKKQGELQPPRQVAAAIFSILALPSLSSGSRYDVRDHPSG